MRTILLLMLLVISGVAVEPPPLATPRGETSADQVTPIKAGRTTAAATTDGSGKDATLTHGREDSGKPGLNLTLSAGAGREGTSNAVKLLLLITILAVAPGCLMMMTSFTRIIIVLGFVRRALGTQTLPPNQVILGLTLFLTLFVMGPTLKKVNETAVQPYFAETITEAQALDNATGAVREFMLKHTRKKDLALFVKVSGEARPKTAADVSFTTLMPAFIISELKTAFQMGFIIFLPFLVIDLVISAVLMALGMMMLPPVIVSMPFKILLFVLVDGWALLVQSLAASYA